MNWTSINADHLKASGYGTIVDRAASVAVGALDPVAEAIADAVARVRRAVAQGGNLLDADASKIPNSLKGVAVRTALYALMERIGLPLDDDQKQTRRDDNSELLRIGDASRATPIEKPDNAAGVAEMQTPQPGPLITKRHRQFTRRNTDGI